MDQIPLYPLHEDPHATPPTRLLHRSSSRILPSHTHSRHHRSLTLQEQPLETVDPDLQGILRNILSISIDILDTSPTLAQVVENQIVINVDNYNVTISRHPRGWQVVLHQPDTGSNTGYYPSGDPEIDAGLSRYLPQ